MQDDLIGQVRRFNRLVTQRVGALEETYLSRGRPLAEARVLFEAGARGVDVRTLRTRLGLDAGYLSRLLRSLEAQGLIALEQQPEDRRVRHVRLTPKGRAEYRSYNRLSDGLARSMLGRLSEPQRGRLTAAMGEVERLLRMAGIDLRVEPPDSTDARACLADYFKELSARFETGFDPARSNPASEADMTPPAGYLVLARLEGAPVGCGALKRAGRGIGEIKRMWTAPAARGQGVAMAVLHKLEEIAREQGIKTLRLETNRALKAAQALYRREGYREVAPFNAEPYAHHWFEKTL